MSPRIWIPVLLITTGAAGAYVWLAGQFGSTPDVTVYLQPPEPAIPVSRPRLGIPAATMQQPDRSAEKAKLGWLFRTGNYEQLEHITQKTQQDFKAGRLDELGLILIFSVFEDETAPESHHDAWIQQFPKSYPARLARGMYHRTVGLKHRGDKFIKDTPPEQMEAMRASLDLALDDLQASLDMDDRPILSYVYLLSIGRRYKGRKFLDHYFNKALRLAPKTFVVRRTYFYSLEPRWGGSIAAMEDFIDEARAAGLPDAQISELEGYLELELAQLAWEAGNAEYDKKELMHRANGLKVYQRMGDEFWLRYVSLLLKHDDCVEAMPGLDQLIRSEKTEKSNLIWLRGERFTCLYRQTRYDEARADMQALAELGDTGAQLTIGEWLYHGQGVAKNTTEAMSWFRKAAAQGDDRAKELLKGRHDHP